MASGTALPPFRQFHGLQAGPCAASGLCRAAARPGGQGCGFDVRAGLRSCAGRPGGQGCVFGRLVGRPAMPAGSTRPVGRLPSLRGCPPQACEGPPSRRSGFLTHSSRLRIRHRPPPTASVRLPGLLPEGQEEGRCKKSVLRAAPGRQGRDRRGGHGLEADIPESHRFHP